MPVPLTLLIDLDGVVRRWDPAHLADPERRHGLPAGAIARAAFGDAHLLRRAVTGAIADEEWRAEVTDRLVAEYGPHAASAVAEWSEPSGAVDPDVLDLIRDVRRYTRVGLVTNATSRLRRDLAVLGIDAEFDAIFNTAELGVAKPDSEAFLGACRGLDVKPERCAFVDDSEANVAAAIGVGLRGHRFRDVAALRSFVALL